MIRAPLSLAMVLAALSVVGCNAANPGGHTVANFCPSFKTTTTPQTGTLAVSDPNASAAVECVRRWAFAMAPSRDAAGLVAQAAVAACDTRLAAWNQAALSQGSGAGQGESGNAMSILTGQPTNAVAEHDTFLHGRALLYVIQARAGHCAPPPIVNGAPSGA